MDFPVGSVPTVPREVPLSLSLSFSLALFPSPRPETSSSQRGIIVFADGVSRDASNATVGGGVFRFAFPPAPLDDHKSIGTPGLPEPRAYRPKANLEVGIASNSDAVWE